MPAVEWDDSYTLGIQQIDQQHHHLVELLNKIYEEFTRWSTAENIGLVLDELIDYTTHHFAYEEHLMAEIAYPGLTAHRIEHNRFVSRVTEMHYYFHSGNKNLSLELVSLLIEWLTDHILTIDARYGNFLSGNDISTGKTI